MRTARKLLYEALLPQVDELSGFPGVSDILLLPNTSSLDLCFTVGPIYVYERVREGEPREWFCFGKIRTELHLAVEGVCQELKDGSYWSVRASLQFSLPDREVTPAVLHPHIYSHGYSYCLHQLPHRLEYALRHHQDLSMVLALVSSALHQFTPGDNYPEAYYAPKYWERWRVREDQVPAELRQA